MNINPPTVFDDFIINKKFAHILSTFNKDNLSNILLYGLENTGKKTLVYAFINHLYKHNTIKVYEKEESLKYKQKKYTCKYKYTKYYYDIDLLENIKVSKYVINHFIDHICSNKCVHNSYRVFIIHNLHILDKKLIQALLHIMEKNYNNNRFILVCNSTQIPLFNKINSYCFALRCRICPLELDNYINKNKINFSKKHTDIAYSCNNLYHINLLNNCKGIKKYQPIDIYVKKIYNSIKKYKTILFIEKVREIIYEMHLLNFNMSQFILLFIKYIIDKNSLLTNTHIHMLYHLAAKYDSSNPGYFQPFTLIESFFIEIKKMKVYI